MDPGLLAGADADGLSAFDIAYRVGLGVFQSDQGDGQIISCRLGQLFVIGHDVGKKGVVYDQLVTALFKSDAEDLFLFDRRRYKIRIDLKDAVAALFLFFVYLKSFLCIIGGDDTVGDFSGNQACGAGVTGIGQGNEITEGGHSVGASCSGVSAGDGRQGTFVLYPVDFGFHVCQGQADGRACGRNMLKGSRCGHACGCLQFFDQLPSVQGIQQVDITGPAVKDLDGKFGTVFHVDAGRLLIGVASVFKL